jgi:anthranilate phosphoribosyltransferase
MRHAGPTRRELGIRTAFNLLGPLTNPAGARRQIIGVPRPELTELVARALAELGVDRAWVVHGAGGLDELSTLGYTKVSEVRGGTVSAFYVHPSQAGLATTTAEKLAGGTAADNATIVTAILGGEKGPRRDIVIFNAAAALVVAGRAASLSDGVRQAEAAIASGRAAQALEGLRRNLAS